MKIQKQNKSLYSARERRRMRIGFLYAVPWLIGFLVFKGYPFLSSLYYSFTDMNLQKSSYWYTGQLQADIYRPSDAEGFNHNL